MPEHSLTGEILQTSAEPAVEPTSPLPAQPVAQAQTSTFVPVENQTTAVALSPSVVPPPPSPLDESPQDYQRSIVPARQEDATSISTLTSVQHQLVPQSFFGCDMQMAMRNGEAARKKAKSAIKFVGEAVGESNIPFSKATFIKSAESFVYACGVLSQMCKDATRKPISDSEYQACMTTACQHIDFINDKKLQEFVKNTLNEYNGTGDCKGSHKKKRLINWFKTSGTSYKLYNQLHEYRYNKITSDAVRKEIKDYICSEREYKNSIDGKNNNGKNMFDALKKATNKQIRALNQDNQVRPM